MINAKILKNLSKTLTRHAPDILFYTGLVEFAATVVLAVRATPKAVEMIKDDSRRNHDGDPYGYTKKEAIKSSWKCYIPAVITGTGSILCLVFAHSTNARRYAALSAACSLSETALKEYQSKVIETVGEKKEESIRDAINQDIIKANPVTDKNVVVTGKGDMKCYDRWSGRYFYSDAEKMRRAALDVSKQMLDEMYVSLNDFYRELGLREIPIGEELGWNANRDGLVEIRFSAQLSEDETPCIVLDFTKPPNSSYMR